MRNACRRADRERGRPFPTMRSLLAVPVAFGRAAAAVLALAGLFVTLGCATASAPQRPPVPPAVVWLENLAPYAWHITATRADGPAHAVTVAVGATERLELPAGTYAIAQEAPALAQRGSAPAVRHFEFTVAAGEAYRWRLVTLATVARGLER